jgi:uncharacterized protein
MNPFYTYDWDQIGAELDERGYAILSSVLDQPVCSQLIDLYKEPSHFRKAINMERYRFGRGEYQYFKYPLPPLLQQIRVELFPHLVPVANRWMKALQIPMNYPNSLEKFHGLCHEKGQILPTPLILKYGKGGFNTLHQDLYGAIYFPFQAVIFLNQPDQDFTGGEFVMLEQIPRAQSKAIVLSPKQGDILIFTTQFRPEKGNRGYYRVNMKHGVSELHAGERHTLGVIFHDAS